MQSPLAPEAPFPSRQMADMPAKWSFGRSSGIVPTTQPGVDEDG